MAGEVAEDGVIETTGAPIGLDHHHLVAVLGIDILVRDLGDAGVSAKRTDGAAAGPVAENGFDKDILGRALRWVSVMKQVQG